MAVRLWSSPLRVIAGCSVASEGGRLPSEGVFGVQNALRFHARGGMSFSAGGAPWVVIPLGVSVRRAQQKKYLSGGREGDTSRSRGRSRAFHYSSMVTWLTVQPVKVDIADLSEPIRAAQNDRSPNSSGLFIVVKSFSSTPTKYMGSDTSLPIRVPGLWRRSQACEGPSLSEVPPPRRASSHRPRLAERGPDLLSVAGKAGWPRCRPLLASSAP
jgi:hypothetical protein